MSVLAVGSIALDSIKTPFTKIKDALGGSATYFCHAASFFTDTKIVGVVGNDFPKNYIEGFKKRNIDIQGLEISSGKTFRWEGEYKYDLNVRETISLNLNVFEKFSPKLPEFYKKSSHVFLANINPVLQLNVLDEMEDPKLTACDTMDCWIKGDLKNLLKLLKKVDIFFINDSEARELSGSANLIKAAEKIRKMGPKIVIIKKGEHGSILYSKNEHFLLPAYPLENVIDPTGAGDSFAGGFMGYISTVKKINKEEIKRALVFGTVTASYCVEDFSIKRFKTITTKDLCKRYQRIKSITQFSDNTI
jgi:sugar/nucleoside kinase (ribokinase family)